MRQLALSPLGGTTRRWLALGIVVAGAICVLVVLGAYAVKGWLTDSRPELSDNTAVGMWRGDGGAELTFSENGTFRASQIPTAVLGPPQSAAETTSGAGTWKLAAAPNDAGGRLTQVSLIFATLDDYPVPYATNVRSDSVDDDVILFWFISDPDLGHRFVLKKDLVRSVVVMARWYLERYSERGHPQVR